MKTLNLKFRIVLTMLLALSTNAFAQTAWKSNFGGSGNDIYNSITAVSDGIIAVGYSAAASFGNGDWTGVTGKGSTGNFSDAVIVKYSR